MSKVHGINSFVLKRKQLLARMEHQSEDNSGESNVIADDSAAATKSES